MQLHYLDTGRHTIVQKIIKLFIIPKTFLLFKSKYPFDYESINKNPNIVMCGL